jgi:hypothetical protein
MDKRAIYIPQGASGSDIVKLQQNKDKWKKTKKSLKDPRHANEFKLLESSGERSDKKENRAEALYTDGKSAVDGKQTKETSQAEKENAQETVSEALLEYKRAPQPVNKKTFLDLHDLEELTAPTASQKNSMSA